VVSLRPVDAAEHGQAFLTDPSVHAGHKHMRGHAAP
jgi:hypothetical protein